MSFSSVVIDSTLVPMCVGGAHPLFHACSDDGPFSQWFGRFEFIRYRSQRFPREICTVRCTGARPLKGLGVGRATVEVNGYPKPLYNRPALDFPVAVTHRAAS